MLSRTVKHQYNQLNISNDYIDALHKDLLYIKVKFQLEGVAEVVLHHHDEVVCFFTLRRVVQTELPVLQQVAVVGQEGDAVVHFQLSFSLKLKIADSVKRVSEVALLFQLTADFHRLTLRNLVGHRHRFHREGIGLLDVHVIVARYECE